MDLAEWEARFSRIRRSTILQSYDYARAVCPIYGQRARWGAAWCERSRVAVDALLL